MAAGWVPALLPDSHPSGWQLLPTAVLSFTQLGWFFCLPPCPSSLLSMSSVPLTWEKARAAAVFPDPLPAHKSLHLTRDTCKMLSVAARGQLLHWGGTFPLVLPAWVTRLPVAICLLVPVGTQEGWLKVTGCVLRGSLQPITPQLQNEGNTGWVSYTSAVFSQKVLHTWYFALCWSTAQAGVTDLCSWRDFLSPTSQHWGGYFCKRGEAEYWSYEQHTYMLRWAH